MSCKSNEIWLYMIDIQEEIRKLKRQNKKMKKDVRELAEAIAQLPDYVEWRKGYNCNGYHD